MLHLACCCVVLCEFLTHRGVACFALLSCGSILLFVF